MTIHTFKIELPQRHTVRYSKGDKTPSPPRLSDAMHILCKATEMKAARAIAVINESIPFQIEFSKVAQYAADLNDAGYKFTKVSKEENIR